MAAKDTGGALDLTGGVAEGGVLRLGVETALPEISAWEERLAASGDPDLRVVSATLGELLGTTLESIRRQI